MGTDLLRNFVGGDWRKSAATEYLDISNPATGEVLGRVPLSPAREVDEAARAATEAFRGWRETPATERVQYLFKLKTLLEEQFEDLSRTITLECGKTLAESRGEMGPVITAESKQRIEQLIAKGAGEGAKVLVDGRNTRIKGYEGGNFLRPTLLDYERLQGEVLQTEIFGPVLTLLHVNTVEDAITLVNSGRYGNMACLFTESGAAARKFRHEVEAGNIGINIGVAAPTAPFPFSGARESFFGDLHGQGHDAVDCFTQKKVVVERWPKESNP